MFIVHGVDVQGAIGGKIFYEEKRMLILIVPRQCRPTTIFMANVCALAWSVSGSHVGIYVDQIQTRSNQQNKKYILWNICSFHRNILGYLI